MDNTKIQELKRLAEAATPGPWTAHKYGCITAGPFIEYANGSAQKQIVMMCATASENDDRERQQENTEYVAALVNAAPELIAIAERATAPAASASIDTPTPDAMVRRSEWDDAKTKRQSFNGWRIDYGDCDMKLFIEETLTKHVAAAVAEEREQVLHYKRLWETAQDQLTALRAAPAPVSAVAGDEYSRNLLESCANWLESRSNTVWATENDSTSLMRSYAADLRMIRASLPSAGAPECDGCDPAEGFCKVCREREKSAGAPVSRKNEDPNWMGKIPHAFNSPAPVSEAEQAELDPNDLRIETYSPTRRPSWTAHTDRGIRITHIPTGVTVSEHEDRSQHRNKAVALEKLRALVAATPADAQELPALFTETDYRMLHSVAAYMALNDSSPRCAADLRSLAERIRAALATAMRQPQGDDTALLKAVGNLVKAKGRFHTEQNYRAVVAAYDSAVAAKQAEKEPT